MSDDLTCILYKKDDLRLERKAPREPQDGEVVIRMDSVGICGSDVHYWTHGAIAHFVVKEPMVIGHEAAGVVERYDRMSIIIAYTRICRLPTFDGSDFGAVNISLCYLNLY